jgi:hypothetical protein
MAKRGRKKKLIKVRKPKLKITSRGVKVTKPAARIGGKTGLNISSKGVSASHRTKCGTLSTRTGWTRRKRKKGCSLMLLALSVLPLSVVLAHFLAQ